MSPTDYYWYLVGKAKVDEILQEAERASQVRFAESARPRGERMWFPRRRRGGRCTAGCVCCAARVA